MNRSVSTFRSSLIERTIQFEQLEDRRLLAAIQMTAQEQLLVELINRARANPEAEAARFGIPLNEDLEPGEISSDPKQPLAPNQQLIEAARGHSDDMLNFNFFAHVNPFTEKGPSDRAQDAGYPRGAGENIAWFGSGAVIDRTQQVYDRHEALYVSEGHRVNFFNDRWREIGNGIKFGFFTDHTSERPAPLQSIMVTENFGNQGGNAFITGVAYTDQVRANNFYEIGEGIGGLTVTATRQLDGASFTVDTGPSGGYGLRVSSGVYTVTGRKAGLPTFTISGVVVDGSNEKVDFNTRNPGLGSIRGHVFNDLNENGAQDAGEPGLANETIYIDSVENDRFDAHEFSITTDASGNYNIVGLRPGEYRIRISHPPERERTFPNRVDRNDLIIRVGQNFTGVDFGLAPLNEAPTVVGDFVETQEGVSIAIDVVANDSDVDGTIDRSTLKIVAGPVNENAQVRVDRATGNVVYVPEPGFTGPDAFIYTVEDDNGLESGGAQVDILVRQGVGQIWQNSTNKFDVNADGTVSAFDVLLIVIDINDVGARTLGIADPAPPPYIDASGDGFLSAIDALIVTIEINQNFQERQGNARVGAAVAAMAKKENTPIDFVREAIPTIDSRRQQELSAATLDSIFVAEFDDRPFSVSSLTADDLMAALEEDDRISRPRT